jgi:hypothetical protein
MSNTELCELDDLWLEQCSGMKRRTPREAQPATHNCAYFLHKMVLGDCYANLGDFEETDAHAESQIQCVPAFFSSQGAIPHRCPTGLGGILPAHMYTWSGLLIGATVNQSLRKLVPSPAISGW